VCVCIYIYIYYLFKAPLNNTKKPSDCKNSEQDPSKSL